MTKILVADDHSVVRCGVKSIIMDELASIEFGEAQNYPEILERLSEQPWNLLITDISMPGGNILELLSYAKIQYPLLPVLVLSIHAEEQYAMHVLKAGAAGYLSKNSLTDELVIAVRKVLAGEKYISPEFAQKMAIHSITRPDVPLHELLSSREFQVMLMIASGKSIKQISEELFLSVQTVSTYRRRILDKMNMKTQADIIQYAIKHQLV